MLSPFEPSHPAPPPFTPPADGENLSALLTAAAEGDDDAFAALYDATSSRAYGLAMRILRDGALADEVTLEAYTQVWRQARRFDARRGSVLTWLLLIVRSRALDRIRSKHHRVAQESGPEPLDLLADGLVPAEENLLADERAALVRRALGSLPAEQREAIEAAFFGGLTHTEVAARLGAPLGTVKSRIRLGLAALRRALAPTPGEFA